MPEIPIERIKKIKSFPALVKFLRDDLDWSIPDEDIDELTYEYDAEDDLGLSDDIATKINDIRQLRPFSYDQEWGIFYIDFEPKKLPIAVLRKLLQKLRPKKKGSNRPNMRLWDLEDLLFINSYGLEDDRAITFAHFSRENEDAPPVLRTITWNSKHPDLHLERCFNELQNLKYDPDLSPQQWREKWVKGFVLQHRYSITTSKALAKQLANLAQDIRKNASEILSSETEKGPFKKMMAKFKKALIHDLTEEDFADMYAQTIAYGLLYTAIRNHVAGGSGELSTERTKQLVLPTNPFLKEVFEDFFDVGSRKWSPEHKQIIGIEFDALGINEIVATLKDEQTDFDAILRDFGNKNPNEDPVIHFYELFLKEYDKQKRKSRGVYYTPQPVVSFIVRSVHEVLKSDFKLPLGLASAATWADVIKQNPDIKLPEGVGENEYFVQILDPATGTGTFLVETIALIHKTMKEHWQQQGKDDDDIKQLWSRYVPDSLLPRLYGFELMMAPYAIAHMKIGIKLFETGYQNFQQDNKRVCVYLTNTLEKPVDTTEYLDTLDPAMAEETRQANEIKKKNSVTVVIGNPPYASFGQMNRGAWILNLLKDYKKGLEERKINLDDDFIKFIRFAHWKLDEARQGIFAMITSNTFIDGITHRQMRRSLLETFEGICIYNLHGSYRKGETEADGGKDENVFDIQQGVSINIFVKYPEKLNSTAIKYRDLWGLRTHKFATLLSAIFDKIKWKMIAPTAPNWFFIEKDLSLEGEYSLYESIHNIFPQNSVGILTSRDEFVTDYDKNTIERRIKDFYDISISDKDLCDKYQIRDNISVPLSSGRRQSKFNTDLLVRYNYRQFDKKYIYFSRCLIHRTREETQRHLLNENISLISCRQEVVLPFHHVFCASGLVDDSCLSNKSRERGYVFPLYLYPVEGYMPDRNWPAGKDGRTPNLDPKVVKQLANAICLEFVSEGKDELQQTFGPENLFHYIYSIFHSPTYRSRYAEFLKIDFPRVPITTELGLFRGLCGLGGELVSLHLMESDKLNDHITTFPVSGDNTVTKVGEKKRSLANVENAKGKLFINKTQYFEGIPEEVWNFQIGGYQVCYKWLYDRKKAGRKLSKEDIEHYHKIVVVLSETIKIMMQIDEAIDTHGGWPMK